MSTPEPEVREAFTVQHTRIRPGAIPLFLLTFVLFLAGLFLMGSAASSSTDSSANAWLFFAGLVVTCAAFWLPMTFHKR